MPNLNVCTGPAFGVGSSGQLVIAGSNSNPWTLAAPIASANGLNTDAANGLWTAPHGSYASIQDQSGAVSQALTTSSWPFPATAATFTNPSAASKMRIKAAVQARMTVNMNGGSAAYVTAFASFTGQTGVVRNGATPAANPTATTMNGLWVSAWNNTDTVVAAGATATLNFTCSATLFAGSAAVTVTQWVVWVEFLAWLLDPTQAGGIS